MSDVKKFDFDLRLLKEFARGSGDYEVEKLLSDTNDGEESEDDYEYGVDDYDNYIDDHQDYIDDECEVDYDYENEYECDCNDSEEVDEIYFDDEN